MKIKGKLKERFEEWFRTKKATPAYRWWMLHQQDETLQIAVIQEYLSTLSIALDRDIKETCIKIWDYRKGEPLDPIIVDCTYVETDQNLNGWWFEAFERVNTLLEETNVNEDEDASETVKLTDREKEIERLKFKPSGNEQFFYSELDEKVHCKCNAPAVWFKTAFICGSITARPCKYN